MPEGIRYVNLDALQEKRRREGQPLLGVYGAEPGGAKVQAAHSTVDSSLTWPFLTWLRSVTRLPILLKVWSPRRHVPPPILTSSGVRR